MSASADDAQQAYATISRHVRRGIQPLGLSGILSSSPFVLTFVAVAFFAWKTLFPLLAGGQSARDAFRQNRRTSLSIHPWLRTLANRIPAITFSVTVALSAVLAELIFCEISDILDPVARSAALQVTITILLVSLVIVTPAIEIHSITSAAGWKFSGLTRGTVLLAWLLDVLGLVAWLAAFWWIGRAVIGTSVDGSVQSVGSFYNHRLSEGSLERIGIIGISLMASLAGFAAVSSLWQTFGVRARKVSETDVARKQAGLDATIDLLNAKESRLRALEHKMADSPNARKSGFFNMVVGAVRGSDPDTTELASLHLEISGLQMMQFSLSNSHQVLKARRESQLAAATAFGKLCISASYAFSLYCLYRIAATSIATLRRWWHPTASFAATDPINNVLALVAKHWDPSLDRAAWSRQISFLLSGLMLLASFNAVLQTVLLFSRFTPANLLRSAQQNLALLVSQISATYVVSSALLLRSNLPAEMGSVIEGALGAPLDTAFVERWFEGWFLGACAVTAAGIFVGRKVVGTADWEDDVYEDEIDVETGGKRFS